MFYIRQKGLINDKSSNFFVLPLHSQQSLQEIYIWINEATSNFILKSDIISCITGKELIDNVINGFFKYLKKYAYSPT